MEKRSSSQHISILPGRAIQQWEVIEINLMCVGVESLSGEKHSLLVFDKASRLHVAYPLPSKQVEGVVRHLLELYLTLGIPKVTRSNGGD